MTAFIVGGGKRIKLPPVRTVTPLQARMALLESGLLADVELLVATSPVAYLSWTYAIEINRDDPLIGLVAEKLKLDADQINAMFERAAQL